MNTLEKYQVDVEAAQKLLERAISSLEEAKKQEKAIKLMVPRDGELYTNTVLGYPSTRHEGDVNKYFLCTFSSTNKAQATAFADALAVMAEMRMQEGIVAPDGEVRYFVIESMIKESGFKLNTQSYYSLFPTLSPAYKTKEHAQKAIDNVGEQRIIEATKTLLFMTPESRGEV